MKLPYQLISWCLRQGIATQLRSPRQDLHNGYLIAEILSKLYPEHFKIVQFDNQSSAAVTSRNWNRIAAVAPKIKLSLTNAEIEACKAGDEQALVSILKRVHTLHTGKDLVESKQSTRPISTDEDRSLTKGHASKLGMALNANHQNQTITQDPLKFLVTRNLDNMRHTSAHEQTTFATATNLSTILVHGDADGLNAASSRPNNSMLSMRPSTTAADNDDVAFRMNPGATGTVNENKMLPKNVPKFVRGAYISTRRLLMELSTACKNAITSLPELQNMLEMIDPRVDTIYPFINICLRVPSENATELFDALILELKPFTTLLVDQISANPFLFWELLKLLVLSSINLRRVTGPKAEFPRQATEYLLHLIAELGRSSPSSLALIFSHIIRTRLMHVIDLREFGLHNFVELYMAFLPIMEHESALDIITTIIQLADNNFKERSGGRYMTNPSKLRLAVLTSIVSVISGYFIKFSHDPRFMIYGMFVLPWKQQTGEGRDDRSKTSSPVRFSERDNMHASTGTAQSCSEYSVSTGYGVMVQGDEGEEILSGRELLEQMLLDILYVITRILVGSENLLIDERVIVLDLLFRCCAANPQELMPHAEATILVVFKSIVNRTKPYITLISDNDDAEGNARSSYQPYKVPNIASNYGVNKLTSLCTGTDLQTIPEEGSKKGSLSGNPTIKAPRRASIASLSVPETHAIVDSLHSSTHTASLGPSVSVGASQISIVPGDRHSPIAVMNTVASERSATETSPEHSAEGMVKVDAHDINCQYDNIPYLHYETLLSLVLILRRYASLCIKDHYDTPLILVSYNLERAIMDFHERLSPVSLLIGILSSTGRNMDMMKHITPLTIQAILDDPEKAEAYNETLHVLKCIINVLIQYPDMTEIVFAALDGKGDFEQSIVSYPPHCYLKIVQALYPGSELMEIVPALLCVAVMYSKEFLASKSIDPNNYFIAIARLIEFIPDISCFVYDHLSDELFTQITDPRVSETASSLLTDLLIELDSMVDEQELQASIHALIQYAFNSNEVLLPTARKAFSGKFMEECQQSVIAFLNSLTMVPTALSLMRDILIKTDSEDYGNVHLAKFIRSILEESSVGED
ncbi:Hypothetical protein GLP15_1435 [Giardia lamblia P15]|uniref:CH-like domain-containing protein n=1 Tax=Giardia intestinalis (strain P15) TaxID=658858 RepID=E1F464_GIAIA|nr:Hypothetical protein GLP15_1435 [Giardia lamblia P15]